MAETLIKLLNPFVKIICYFGMIMGLWIVLSPLITPIINRKKISTRYTKNTNNNKYSSNLVIKHLQMLIRATHKSDSEYALFTYFVVTVSLSFITLLLIRGTDLKLFMKIAVIVCVTFIPYIYMRIKLHGARIEASYEAEPVITELINQYRINYFNIIEAIDKTVVNLKNCPYTKKALLRLGLAAKQYRNSAELEDIINEFTYSLDTRWAVLLAQNINLSIENGVDISESLNGIIQDISVIKNIIEDNKRVNNEAFFMIKYFAPFTYLISVYVSLTVFGFTVSKYISYQIYTPMGLKCFIVTMASILINYIVYFAFKKPKYDY